MFGMIFIMDLFIHGASANVEKFIKLWKGDGLSLWDLISFFVLQIAALLAPLVFYKSFNSFGEKLSSFVNVYRTHSFLISGNEFSHTAHTKK